MFQLEIFEYEKAQDIRTIDIDGAIWFVAKDVCKVLGIKNHADTISRLDTDEKRGVGITDGIGREQNTIVINEPGLYRIIFKSNKAGAKKFQKWVYHEVIPKIRKTGAYALPGRSLPVFVI